MTELLESTMAHLRDVFDPEELGAILAQVSVNLIAALAVLAAFYVVWRVLHLVLGAYLYRRLDRTSASFVETIVKYGLLTIGLVAALDAAGIHTAAVMTSLGVAGLTVGFAARDALSNLISGILIFLDRPFVIGDLVEVDGSYGRVDKITLRSTRIITSDGRMLAVPNTEVINKTVASYTNFPHLRLGIAVTVGVNEDLTRTRGILLSLVQGDDDYLTDPPPRVVVTQLNDYNVEVELQVWLDDEKRHVEKRFELRERVFEALNREGVEMPFETLQLAPLRFEDPGPSALRSPVPAT